MRLSRSTARAVKNDAGIGGSATAPRAPPAACAAAGAAAAGGGLSGGSRDRAYCECTADSPVINAAAICTPPSHIYQISSGEREKSSSGGTTTNGR